MRCEFCRIEWDPDASSGSTELTVHEGVALNQAEKDALFAALDVAADDAEQEALNLCLQKFQALFAIKGTWW